MIERSRKGRNVLFWMAAPFAAMTASLVPGQEKEPGTAVAGEETAQETAPAPEDGDDLFTLRPVHVKARKWDELQQEVPESVAVFDEEQIRDAGARSVKDLSFFVPNLFINEFTARRLSFPSLRGIGSGQGDPAVTTYIDGVPQLSVSSSSIPLLDVESIEFLRGPQGSLYGRNSLGGLIHYHTRVPTDVARGEATVSAGSYDWQELSISTSGPLVEDQLGLGISGLFSSRDGFTKNDFTGNRIDERNSVFGRGQLVFTPNDRDAFRLVLYGEGADDGPFALNDIRALRQRPHRVNQDFEGENTRDLYSSSLVWDHLTDHALMTNALSFVAWDVDETTDFDFTPIDGIRRHTEESQNYLNHEIHLSSKDGESVRLADDASLRWLVGLHTFVSDSERMPSVDFRPGGAGIFFDPAQVGVDTTEGDFDDFGTAPFGQVTVTLWEDLDLSAGLRYDYESKRATINHTFETGGFTVLDVTTRESDVYDEWSPMGAVAYRFTDDLMAFARVAKGFKAGGYNNAASAGQFAFGPESALSYELGEKATCFGDRLLVNATLFYVDWEDMQLTVFDPAAGGRVENAGESTSKGVEVEVVARPWSGVDVIAGYGYADTEFDEFVDSFGIDDSGNRLPFAPETTRNLGLMYSHPCCGDWRAYVRGDYFRVGPYFYDASNLERESYELFNFRVGLSSPRVRVEAFLNNAFDEEYIPIAFQFNPADPTFFIGESGTPRFFGVSVGVIF